MKLALKDFSAVARLYENPINPAFITGINSYCVDTLNPGFLTGGWQGFKGNAIERTETPEQFKKLLKSMQAAGVTFVNLQVTFESGNVKAPDYAISELI